MINQHEYGITYESSHQREAIILGIDKKVIQKIEELHTKRPSYSGTIEDAVEIYISGAREMQLRILLGNMVEISLKDDPDTSINLNYTQLLEMQAVSFPAELREYREKLEEATKIGELLGTEDFLEILVPAHITDPQVRALYFTPWTKEMLKKKTTLYEHEDGSASADMPTVLPNIKITYYYPPLETIPERTLCLHAGDYNTNTSHFSPN